MDPLINEFVLYRQLAAGSTSGTTLEQFVEIKGEANTKYDEYWILEIEGDSTGNQQGIIEDAFQVGVTNADGYWITPNGGDGRENGAVTYMLVTNFMGMETNADGTVLGDDIDTNNDGTIDAVFWDAIIDDVAFQDDFSSAVSPDRVYSTTVLQSGYDGRFPDPYGASRIPDGEDTNTAADWIRNDFGGNGLPGVTDGATQGEAVNTPGAKNQFTAAASTPLINEFVYIHSTETGATTAGQFQGVEIRGTPNTDYGNYWVLEIEGDGTGNQQGIVEDAFQVGTTNAQGYWVTPDSGDGTENGSVTYLLVYDFTGTDTIPGAGSVPGSDIDTDNDGTIDATFWTAIVDDVAFKDDAESSFNPDQVYSTSIIQTGFDGRVAQPGAASRIPNGTDTNSTSDWVRNDFGGNGLSGLVDGANQGEAVNTLGSANLLTPAASDPIINEFVIDHAAGATTSGGALQFVEIFGDPNTNYGNLWVLEIEGDIAGLQQGTIEDAFQVGTTNADGYWTTPDGGDGRENGSVTYLLVEDFTGVDSTAGINGVAGDDIDTDNDGTIDATFWTRIIDDVGYFDDTASTDRVYSASVITPGFDGRPALPGGASRIPNGTDTDTTADWVRNDFGGNGFGSDFAADDQSPGEAVNTPGSANLFTPFETAPIINEFVLDHRDEPTAREFVEIKGDANTDYSSWWVLFIEGDDAFAGQIDDAVQLGTTDANGYYATPFTGTLFEPDNGTLVLVKDFTGNAQDGPTPGDDIDTNNDGVIDATFWTSLSDSVGRQTDDIATRGAGVFYSSTVLLNDFEDAGKVTGASRIADGVDTDSTADWRQNDPGNAGYSGGTDAETPGKARNTPGAQNSVNEPVLTVTLSDAAISENGGTSTVKVTMSVAAVGDTVITLASDDTSEGTVPATVTILDGNMSATAPFTAQDDTVGDGDQTVTVTASRVGFVSDSETIVVTDDDTAELSLTLDDLVIDEGDGVEASTGTVTRNTDTSAALVVNLSSLDTSEIIVPSTVSIAAGASSATFSIDAVDDALVDGTQVVTILASQSGFISGQAQIDVADNEVAELTVTILDNAGVIDETDSIGAGGVRITRNTGTAGDLTVMLSSSDTTEADLQSSAVIPNGSTSVTVDLNAIDDLIVDGTQTITVTASASGFVSGSDTTDVTDNETVSTGDDSIAGTPGDDVFNALSGNDTIAGFAGNDTLRGQSGEDQIAGGAGNDFIAGGNENDTLSGGADQDEILGQGGADLIYGGIGNDDLKGGVGDDVVFGGDGADSMLGQGDVDTLYGEDGEDSVAGGSGDDVIYGGADDDDLFGGGNNDVLYGGAGNDFLRGAAGQDLLFGGAGNDTLFGGDSRDTLNGGAGDDLLNAGTAVDVFVFEAGMDNDTISGFGDDQDTLELASTLVGGLTDIQDILDTYASTFGVSVQFDFATGDALRVNNITETQLLNDITVI